MKGAVFFIVFFLLAIPASAATFTVTNCASAATTEGTLSWAVDQANALNEPSIIEFNIPNTDPGYITYGAVNYWRITPEATLQLKKNGIQIKGSTQTGNANPYGPEIEISGDRMAAPSFLFEISGFNSCVLEGLILSRSSGPPIYISSGNYHKIYGCYIGTDATGEVAAPNSGCGIVLNNSGYNQVGGSGPEKRNVISRSGDCGILIDNSTFNQVINNYIGCNRTGDTGLYNGTEGILINSGSKNNYIAGGNLIAFNGNNGIKIDGGATKYNTLTQNSYFSNGAMGITLENSANDNISAPSISAAEHCASLNLLYIQGTGPANSEIEISKTAVPGDPAGGEGQTSLGFGLSDSSGNWFTYLGTNEAHAGDKLCSTATDNNGNTSGFSQNFPVVDGTIVYRPDAMIGMQADGSDYAGENIFNATGAMQEKSRTMYLGEAAIYYAKIKNSGNISPDQVVISGTGNSTDWEISYYDSKTGSSEITPQVTGSGWATPNIGSAESLEIKLIVKSLGTTPLTKEAFIKAASASNPSRFDIVKAITTAVKSTAPDRYSFVVSAPATAEAGKDFQITITAKNPAGQTTTEVSGRTYLSVDAGTISVSSIESAQFAEDGIWQRNISLNNVGNRTITISNDYISGTTSFKVSISVPGEVAAGGLNRFGPNPYNPLSGSNAVIWYWLNEDKETAAYLFNLQGDLLWKKVSLAGQQGGKAGINSISWDGRNNFGEVLDNGVYLLKITQGGKVLYNGKIIILK